MYVIGLTGGIASGKSVVAAFIADKVNAEIIDADSIAKALYSPGKKGFFKIIEAFGEQYISNGEVDRKKLGGLVFSDSSARLKLNAIIHPLLKEEIQCILNKSARIFVIDAALLFEAELDPLCDTIWAVVADRDTRIKRIAMRNGLDEISAAARIDSQNSDDFFREHADVIIENNGDIFALANKIEELLNEKKISCK